MITCNSKLQNIFFTSDLHVNSKNIISYCNRPYICVEEMNKRLVENWNNKVSNKDIVFMLGDMFWGHKTYSYWLPKLNGQKHWVLGNHDNEQCVKKCAIDGLIQSYNHVKSIKIDNRFIFLSHYPHRSWNHSFHGGWMLYGHCHNTIPDYGLSTDVGVDKWNYEPVSYEELKEYFNGKDMSYNSYLRDDHNSYFKDYEKHFTEKYIEKINEDVKILQNIL